MAGIKDLGVDQPDHAMPIDDVLEGLNLELRAQLVQALSVGVPEDEIVRACAEDGFIVTEWSIRTWRRRHA